MAIRQERVIALINAALDFYTALSRIRTHAQGLQLAVNNHEINKDYAFDTLLGFMSESNHDLFHDYAASISTISIEHAHFSRNIHRNAREAERQRNVRGPATRSYTDHSISIHETTRLILPTAPRPEGMNRRGDIPRPPPSPTPTQSASSTDIEKALQEINRLREQEDIATHTFDHQTPSSTPRIIYTDEDTAPEGTDDEEEPPRGRTW